MDKQRIEAHISELIVRRDWPAAATAILKAYGPELLRYLRRVLHDEDQAKEVFSETSERLWTSLPVFRREASVRTWTFRLAWCAAVDHRRRISRRREEALPAVEVSNIVQAISDGLPWPQTEAKLIEIQTSLEPEERSLLHLRAERGLPWRKVADAMSEGGDRLDEAALRKRFERLRRKLHDMVEDHGLRRCALRTGVDPRR